MKYIGKKYMIYYQKRKMKVVFAKKLICVKEKGVYAEGLNLVSVENAADVENLVKRGNKNRSVGSHNFNEHSSRSHLVVTVQITRQHEVDGNMRMLNFSFLLSLLYIIKTKLTQS